ncbi:MAG: hypothetical protein ACTHO8_09295, partial [Solirubrobacterales bacterium]
MKRLALALAAAALAALTFTATASATEMFCGDALCAAGTTIKAVSEGKAVLDAPFGNVECESTIEAHTTTSGEGGAAGNA